MDAYLYPIEIGFFVFPILALILTGPYAIYQYHRYGAISFVRVLVVYSMIYYLLTVYFLVILPLPDRQSIKPGTYLEHISPLPFGNLIVYRVEHGAPGTLREFLQFLISPTFLQLAFNVVMMIPFGIYMRYYYRCSLLKTVCLAFATSLFFELTQLSGLYGIYPAPYRVADADDLICNTLGGLFGYLLAPLCLFFMPSREKIDEDTRKQSYKVTKWRRFWAYAVDQIVFVMLEIALQLLLFLSNGSFSATSYAARYYVQVMVLYMWVMALLTGGSSIGKKLCCIRLAAKDGGPAGKWQICKRYGFLLLQTALFLVGGWCMGLAQNTNGLLAAMLMAAACFCYLFTAAFYLKILRKLFGCKKPFWYEKISETHYVSVYERREDVTEHNEKKKESQDTDR